MKNISYQNELYRKAIHLSSIWIIFAIYFLGKNYLLAIFSMGILLVLFYEFMRRGDNFIADVLNKVFSKILREDESIKDKFKLSGAIYVFISALLCTIFFTKIIAITAMTVLILGDTAAALVGKKIGKIKFKSLGKTLEGSIAFFIISVIGVFLISMILEVNHGYIIAAISGIFIATLVELISKKIFIDDNLSIPLTVGGIMILIM